jgi:membrane-associated protease RseP (regulator of RpoE activity)
MAGSSRIGASVAVLVAVVVIEIAVHHRAVVAPLPLLARSGGARGGRGVVSGADSTAAGGVDGTVVDLVGALQPGAVVAVRGEHLRRSAVVDERGGFAFRALPVGKYLATASTPDGAVGKAEVTVVADANQRVELRLSAVSGAVSLGGHVRDILGGPVAGAEVWITGESARVVRTGSDGEFAARTEVGPHAMLVRASGYAEASDKLVVRGDMVLDLVVHPASTLRGTVVWADGTGAASAVVRARATGETFEAMTDEEGRFAIHDLASGRYDVEATMSSELGRLRDVNLAPADARELRIALAPAAFVRGRVESSSGDALVGTVRLRGAEAFSQEVPTGADGSYTLAAVAPGIVEVRACAPKHQCTVAKQRVASAGATTVDLTLRPAATLRVHVVDKDGKPIADADANVADFSNCTTGPDGACVIDNLTPRRTQLSVRHAIAGYAMAEIVVVAGETEQNVRLVPGATVRGTVRWDDGQLAAGVHVFQYDLIARTDVDGRYELSNLEPGFVRLEVAAALQLGEGALTQRFGRSSARDAHFSVRAGDVQDGHDLVLARRSLRISGSVVGPDGVLVPYARVGLVQDEDNGDGSSFRAMHAGSGPFTTAGTYANGDGSFTLDSVGVGTYVVWADADALPVGRRAGVAAGSDHVAIHLPAAAVIEGYVRDASGAAVSSFLVHAGTFVARRAERFLDDTGHFRMGGLPAGHYPLTVEADAVTAAAGPMVGDVPAFDLAAGEQRQVDVIVGPAVTVIGRVVTWPDGTPRGGVELNSSEPIWLTAPPTGDDGAFQLSGLLPGEITLRTFDVDGQQEEWTRHVAAGQAVVDVGDLAFTPGRRGYAPFEYASDGTHARVDRAAPNSVVQQLGLRSGDEIVSLDGHRVATLGADSLDGVMDAVTPDVRLVALRGGATEPVTLRLPAPAPHSPPGR